MKCLVPITEKECFPVPSNREVRGKESDQLPGRQKEREKCHIQVIGAASFQDGQLLLHTPDLRQNLWLLKIKDLVGFSLPPAGPLLMNWLTKIISEHADTTAADQSAILSFLRWTNSKCEEEDPSKTKTPVMEKRLKFLAFRIPLLCFVESFSVCLLPEPASLPLTKVFLQLFVLSTAVGCI